VCFSARSLPSHYASLSPYVSVDDLVDLQLVGLLPRLDDHVIHHLRVRKEEEEVENALV